MPVDVGKDAVVFRGKEFRRRGKKYRHRCDAKLRRVASQGGAFVIPAACEASVYLNTTPFGLLEAAFKRLEETGRIQDVELIQEYCCSGCDRILTLRDLQNPRMVEIVEDGDQLRVRTLEKTPF